MTQFSRFAGFLLVLLGCALAFPQSAPTVSQISNLQWLIGGWTCNGQFMSSGKQISSDVSFEFVLGGRWILFRHDDRLPFTYRALSEWGWDAKAQGLVSTIQDFSGSLRVFRAKPFVNGKTTWNGRMVDDSGENDKFEFQEISPTEFSVTYSRLRNGTWAKVDDSTCRKKKD